MSIRDSVKSADKVEGQFAIIPFLKTWPTDGAIGLRHCITVSLRIYPVGNGQFRCSENRCFVGFGPCESSG
jgi:hypothetical protein